jgi:hypothetical protein
MFSRRKLLFLLLVTALSTFAAGYTWTGPSLPVIGDPVDFQIFSVNLLHLTPTSWQLTVNTNYPTAIGGNPVIPNFQYVLQSFGMSDFLITTATTDYGVVLDPHDGLSTGLYKSQDNQFTPDFKTSGQVMGNGADASPRPGFDVYVDPTGAVQLGTGVVTGKANAGANGITQALYTVTEVFSAPINFLGPATGPFTIQMSSYVCANGYLNGTGNTVPEPGTMLLFGSALLFVGFRRPWRKS